MGAGQSTVRVHGRDSKQLDDRAGAQLRARIQLLEELCAHVEPGRRAQVLQQLAGEQADKETLGVANVLSARPPEFQPGQLIAAGSYGRVYAGTYADQPAALKLLLLDEETAHAILNEVRLCLKLNHKNLVQLLDCAVVATNRQAVAAGFPVPATPGSTFAGQHQILPVFGAASSPATPSAANAFSYLPVVSSSNVGRNPFSSSPGPGVNPAASSSSSGSSSASADTAQRDGGDLSAAEAAQQDSGRLPVLSSSLAHACFEVWIAMELCDGGTLAEQLQRGFHCFPGSNVVDMEQLLQVGLDIAHALAYMHRESVCHGDLKTENVLLKTLSPSSAADLHRSCSSCGGSTCCHEDCWMTYLCNNNSSSAGTSAMCPRYCRSCSGDSCWSCYQRAMGGCVEGGGGGSSSPDTSSTCSSSASGPNAERRSRQGLRSSHILSGLCCLGSPSSCATEDDVWEEEQRATLSGCFSCGGCGVMTLEPSAPSRHGSRALAQPQPLQEPQQQPLEGLLGHQPAAAAAAAAPGVFDPLGQLVSASGSQPDLVSPSQSADSAAAGSSGGAVLALPAACHPFREGVPPRIMEDGLLQQLQLPLLAAPGSTAEAAQQMYGGAALEDVPEEEHVAPLSLYTQARQRRRSRCLPHGVVLPAALAAAAAAAALGNGSDAVHGSSATSSNGSSSSGSDDEGGAAGLGRKGPHGRGSLPLLQQGSLRRQGSLDDSMLMLGQPDAAAAAGCSGKPHQADASAVGRPGWQEGGVPAGAGFAAAPVCHDVYAHSLMRPPVSRRARRHSYCYGTSSSYPAPAPVSSFGRPGQPAAASGISATAAAAAIAAVAEAARHDGVRGLPAVERGSRRNRRMSWDDRMLRQQSPGCSSGLLGGALPGLPCLSSTEAAAAQPAPGNPPVAGRRSRRHSWAGYLQPDMSAAAGALGWGMHVSSSVLGRQQREQVPVRTFPLPPSSFDSWFGAAPGGMLGPIPRSSRAGRKARRHSWAGYAGFGQEPVPSRLSGLRALSSCFAPGDGSGTHALAQGSSLQTSPPRHPFSLPPFPGCCGDSSCLRPRDDDDAEDCSRHALLEGAPSSTVLLDNTTPGCLLLSDAEAGAVPSVGCFGRWCSSGSSLASSDGGSTGQQQQQQQRRGRQRRYSWCCGAGSEAELWADLTRSESYSQVGLLPHSVPLSVPVQQQRQQLRKQRRDRRFSWDDFRYHAKPSGGYPRKAISLDVQVSTRSSWVSQPLSEDSSEPPFSPPLGSLYRSSSDASGAAQLALAAALGTQSEGLPQVAPLNDGLSDASLLSPPQRAPSSAQLISMLGSSCSSTPPADPAALPAVQLSSLPASCGSSPAAAQKLPASAGVAAGAAAAGPSAAAAPVSPVFRAEPGSSSVPADTRPDRHADQSLSGPDICLGWPVAASKTSRVRVSLDQPLPLSPSFKQQQPGLPAASDAALSVALAAADCGSVGSSRDVVSPTPGTWQAPSQAQQPAGGSSVGPSSGAGVVPPAVRQVTVQDLLSLCEPTHSTAATWTAGAAAGPAGAAAGTEAAPAQEVYNGALTLHPADNGASLSGADAAQQPAAGAVGVGGKPPGGRGRRWSTGVAAHQLLIRKQLLDVHGSDVLRDMGITVGSPAASCSSTQAAAVGSSEAGSGELQAAAAAPPPPWSLPMPVDADALGLPRTAPRAGSCGSRSSTSSMQGRGSDAALASSNVSAAVNVLGMPRQRGAVVSQRRLSYDIALGTYQLVDQLDSIALTGLALGVDPGADGQQQQRLALPPPEPQQQQQQQQPVSRLRRPAPLQVPGEVQPVEVLDLLPGPGPPDANKNAGSLPTPLSAPDSSRSHPGGSRSSQCSPMQLADRLQDEQMQQHCQAQMQRLLEALAKKGYGGLDGTDTDAAAGSSTQGPQSAPGTAPGASESVASLQHQRQVAHDVARVTQRSYCAKVCDFGFSKCLRVGQSHCSTASAGTITHQAPEVLRSGHLSPAADVYAFGIILWELLARDRPFKGLLEGDLVVGVCDRGLRPTFPPGCPASYVALAQQCWSDDPSQRPTAPQLVQRLNELLYEERRARLHATVGAVPRQTQDCRRRRRHSMPVAGYGTRQRRRSRRMSLFLLPFARQPVVPEDAPLDQQLDSWPLSAAHSSVQHSVANAAPSQGRSCTQQQHQPQHQQQQVAAGSPAARVRRSSWALSWGPGSADSGEGHACTSGRGSSTGNAVASSGGLLASTGAISRLKGITAAAAPAGSGSMPGATSTHSGPAAANAAAGDGTEWFESF